MTAAAPTAALVPVQPTFTDPGTARRGRFPGRYSGLTREAYTLDLRQFTTWCRARAKGGT